MYAGIYGFCTPGRVNEDVVCITRAIALRFAYRELSRIIIRVSRKGDRMSEYIRRTEFLYAHSVKIPAICRLALRVPQIASGGYGLSVHVAESGISRGITNGAFYGNADVNPVTSRVL